MTELPVQRFPGLDGVELAWREVGSGRPFVLLHGVMGSGARLAGQGLVPALCERGYRVILPDLRGHGDSGRPHDPACYPPDILADDVLALIGHLGLDDFDLGGYSMGGKLVLRLLARGARPAHAVVGGQGLDALDAESDRTDGHRRILASVADGAALPAGSPEAPMVAWIRQNGVDARAVGLVLDTFVATPADALRPVAAPTRSSSATETAAACRRARSLPCCLTGGSSWCPATTSQPSAPRSSRRQFSSSSEDPDRKQIALPGDYRLRLLLLAGRRGFLLAGGRSGCSPRCGQTGGAASSVRARRR